jgi:hypothetical protein
MTTTIQPKQIRSVFQGHQWLLLLLERIFERFDHLVGFRAADNGLLEILELKDLVRHLVIDPHCTTLWKELSYPDLNNAPRFGGQPDR